MKQKLEHKYLEGRAFEAEVSPRRQLQSEAPVDMDQVSVRGQQKVPVMSVLDLPEIESQSSKEKNRSQSAGK